MKRIIITAQVNGAELVQNLATEGFSGSACQQASAPFERNAGRVVSEEMTPESQGAAPAAVSEAQG